MAFYCISSEQKDGAVTDSLNVDQEPLSPSSIGSTPSLPSERLVDGSSDGCSITSTDGDASSGLPDRVKCISPPLLATQSKNHTEPSDTTDVDVCVPLHVHVCSMHACRLYNI